MSKHIIEKTVDVKGHRLEEDCEEGEYIDIDDAEVDVEITTSDIIDILSDMDDDEKNDIINEVLGRRKERTHQIDNDYSERLKAIQNKLSYSELEELCEKFGV
ncbi:TPA: hypothetical protein HA253_03060 [Candidatus Woesearchaeota archaeon]|nr:hypothetical protein [Candidatus Woesearchaeota archaeon]